jgi:hypothetical protein
MNQPDYLFVPNKSTARQLLDWSRLEQLQPREIGKLIAATGITFVALKGLVRLGLIFQFLLPVSTLAAILLAVFEISLGIVGTIVGIIAVCALVGLLVATAYRGIKALVQHVMA